VKQKIVKRGIAVAIYRKNGINPLLISIVANKDLSEIPPSPTPSKLPGVYAKQVCKNLSSMRKVLPERKQKLTCAACGRNGQYNLGLMAFDLEKYLSFSKGNKKSDDWTSSIQFSGYFRCHYCNSVDWQFPDQTKAMLQMAVMGHVLALKAEIKDKEIVVGKFATFDGETFSWATEAEEHLLRKLSKEPDNAWIWDRLGNIYIRGGRPDLAVVAFEESIRHDPCQMESHYSLGKILLEAGAKDVAALHLRRMLLSNIYGQTSEKIGA
jgi:tetratricopeptide (TPR) repeat protein